MRHFIGHFFFLCQQMLVQKHERWTCLHCTCTRILSHWQHCHHFRWEQRMSRGSHQENPHFLHMITSPNALRQALHDSSLPRPSSEVALVQTQVCTHAVLSATVMLCYPRFHWKAVPRPYLGRAHWGKEFIKKMTFLNNAVFFPTNKIFS